MGSNLQNTDQNTLFAFGSVPKDGGTFTFYRNMRPVLLAHGIDMRCVTVGIDEVSLCEQSFLDDGCIVLAPSEKRVKKQAQVFVDWCTANDVNLVMAVNSEAILSALPHLPQEIRVISRCATVFDHGYKIAMSCYERLYKIVALSPRQTNDLVNVYGADKTKIMMIPNGTSPERFAASSQCQRGGNPEICLAYLGRIHKEKGALFLPKILKRLNEDGVQFKLLVAGKGVHQTALKRELSKLTNHGSVEFVGTLAPSEIADFFSKVDIYLFPSLYEGSPNALLEAMMAGCVPAAWRLPGIIDFLVEDGVTGVLEETGDCDGLADRISGLYKDRVLLQRLSDETIATAQKRFSLKRVEKDYIELIQTVMNEPQIPWQPVPWKKFQVDAAFYAPLWRKLIPNSVKKLVKLVLFKLSLSNRYE